MNLPKAIEIMTLEKNPGYEGDAQDLEDAFTVALVCMSYCEAIIYQWHWLIGKNSEEKP